MSVNDTILVAYLVAGVFIAIDIGRWASGKPSLHPLIVAVCLAICAGIGMVGVARSEGFGSFLPALLIALWAASRAVRKSPSR